MSGSVRDFALHLIHSTALVPLQLILCHLELELVPLEFGLVLVDGSLVCGLLRITGAASRTRLWLL